MSYSTEVLETIKDHTSENNDFTHEEQIQFTQELMEEFFDTEVSIEEAEIIYNTANNI